MREIESLCNLAEICDKESVPTRSLVRTSVHSWIKREGKKGIDRDRFC